MERVFELGGFVLLSADLRDLKRARGRPQEKRRFLLPRRSGLRLPRHSEILLSSVVYFFFLVSPWLLRLSHF